MIKLITQFDNEKTSLSLATPTCGCCCSCCCCCVISAFTSASVCARNFANRVKKNAPNEIEKIKEARDFGFGMPLGFILIFALSIFLMIQFATFIPILILLIYLPVMTYLLKKRIKTKGLFFEALFSIALFFFLSIADIFTLLLTDGSLYIYLLLSLIIAGILVFLTFSKKYDD